MNNTIDFGAGWSPSSAFTTTKHPRSSTRVSFVDKFEEAVAQKNYDELKDLIKDPQMKKSKHQKMAVNTILLNFDVKLFQIGKKPLELGLNHIFRSIKINPSLVFDGAVATLIENEKILKHNSWCWDQESSVYMQIYEDFFVSYMEGDHTLLTILQKIQSVDPSVLNDISDLSQTIFSPMSSSTIQFLLDLPVHSWRQTVENFDERTSEMNCADLLKIENCLSIFPALYTSFQNFYMSRTKSHQIFLDFFNENIGFGTQEECVLQNKIKDKTVKIKNAHGQYKSLNALCDNLLPYDNCIKKLGLSDAQTLLYNDSTIHHDITWVENGTQTGVILTPHHPNFLSCLIGFGAPALELAFQNQQGINAVQECLKNDYTRAMFAMKAPISLVKTALACIPYLNQFTDEFQNGMDHFMALRKDQNKQVVECVAQYFTNNTNVFGKTFGNMYEYIQSPNKANEYQKLLLKNLVRKDDSVLKKMRSRSTQKRRM